MTPLIKFAMIVALSLSCGACITTQEMPLAPNVIRLDTQASGFLFTGQASSQTMRRAAELTLQNGFTHFRFDQAQVAQGSQYAGTYTSGSATASGNANFATVNANAVSTPVMRPTANVAVTMTMFHANEPGAQGAFDAAQVLQQYKG
jgi:hypothetical protein